MTDVQIIKTPAGEEMVVLPRAEYDALVARAAGLDEDAADVAIYDERKAMLAAGTDAALPNEVSALMLRGDSLVRALRKWRGFTQQELSTAAEISQGYLSDIESGRRAATELTLAKIARVLSMPADWLRAAKRS